MSDPLDPVELGKVGGGLGGGALLAWLVSLLLGRRGADAIDTRLGRLEEAVSDMGRKIDRLVDREERREKDEDHRDAILDELRRELAGIERRLTLLEARRTGEVPSQ